VSCVASAGGSAVTYPSTVDTHLGGRAWCGPDGQEPWEFSAESGFSKIEYGRLRNWPYGGAKVSYATRTVRPDSTCLLGDVRTSAVSDGALR
jgi:hypothetical protein